MTETENKKQEGVIAINGQYIKDLSFENPKAPRIFTEKDVKPKIEVAVDINATKLSNEIYEVELTISANAKSGEDTIFIAELVYAGIFTIKNLPETLIEEVLFIQCPTMIFPFARAIVSNITRDAGFPPLMLNPINFEVMYKNRKDKIKRKKK